MRGILAVPVVALTVVLSLVSPAAATPPRVIVLPGAISAEGITAAKGDTFYAGDVFGGDIYRGDVRRGTAELFIDLPSGTQTVGMDLDPQHDLLFVAGGTVDESGPGKAYVYNTRTRALVANYTFAQNSLINGVTVTPAGAYFTDSYQPKLYFVPIRHGVPGLARTLELTGPAAGNPGAFFINDITSTPSGHTLLVAPGGTLCTIDPVTGVSKLVDGVNVPGADGLVLEGRQLWAVEFNNRVTRWHLSDDLTSGTLQKVIVDQEFRAPVSAAKFGSRLAVVNSHLDTGDFPPTSPTYEVVIVNA